MYLQKSVILDKARRKAAKKGACIGLGIGRWQLGFKSTATLCVLVPVLKRGVSTFYLTLVLMLMQR